MKAMIGEMISAELGPNCVSFPADLSTEAECLRLAREVGGGVVVDAVLLEAGVAQVAPQHRGHAQFRISQLERIADPQRGQNMCGKGRPATGNEAHHVVHFGALLDAAMRPDVLRHREPVAGVHLVNVDVALNGEWPSDERVAKARGIASIAARSGLGRESLYKALSGEGNPSFATILKVTNALGIKLHAEPMHAR